MNSTLLKSRLILVTVFSVLCSSIANAGLKIYYIRHAEGGHNVKKQWEAKGVPESEWPPYVGNPDEFTPKGIEEVKSGTEKLNAYDFDFVATSPLWRARNTVRPYLDAKKKIAEIWPELAEAAGMIEILDKDLPEVKGEILNKGKAMQIEEDEKGVLIFREGVENNYKGAPRGSIDRLNVAHTKHVTLHVIDLIEKRFGNSEKSILLTGHNSAGVSLLKLLLQEAPTGNAKRGIRNVGLWMVEQQDDGSYQLMMYNDEPYTPSE